MEQNLKPVFTESQPALVYSCIFIAMKSNPVTKLQTQLLKTMLHRTYALSSMTEAFNEECAKLCSIFCRLYYPVGLTNSTINIYIIILYNMFIQNIATKPEKKTDEGNMIRIVLPLRDQIAARQLRDLSNKIAITLQPIFVSKKLEQDLKPEEIKLSIVNQQCIGYKFAWDLCDADYIGYTGRHLHQRIAEHKYSAIGKHFLEAHSDKNLLNEGQFRIL